MNSDASFADNPGLPEFAEEIQQMKTVDYSFAEAFQRSTLAKPINPVWLDLYISESMKVPFMYGRKHGWYHGR